MTTLSRAAGRRAVVSQMVCELRATAVGARRAVIGAVVFGAAAVWLTNCGGERSGEDAAHGGDASGNRAAVGNSFAGTASSAGGSNAGSGGTGATSGAGNTQDAGAGGAVASVAGAGSCPDAPPKPEAGRTVTGDLFIASASDAEAAQDVSEITGSLEVLTSHEGVLSLPNLTAVRGGVRVSGGTSADGQSVIWPRVTELRLPNLTTVGDELFARSPRRANRGDLRASGRGDLRRRVQRRQLHMHRALRPARAELPVAPMSEARDAASFCRAGLRVSTGSSLDVSYC